MEMYKAYSTGFTAEAFQKGEEKGVKKGEARSIVRILRFRFKDIPLEIVKLLKKVKSTEILGTLTILATTCSTLDEFVQTLRNVSSDHAQ